jgi:hypothetical protein
LWLICFRASPFPKQTNGKMSTRSRIVQAIEEIAAAQKKTLAPLADDLALTSSGLDSLCFALLVGLLPKCLK